MEFEERIKAIKLFIFDVDGVMTDGGIYYSDTGDEMKRFNVKDGHGIKLLQRSGVEVAIITARTSNVVKVRAANLGIHDVIQGALDKKAAYEFLKAEKKLEDKEIAYMGDDIIDLPILMRAGFSACPEDAHEDLLDEVDYRSKKRGGDGSVREVCDLVLKTQGKYAEVTEKYRK